MAKLIIRNYPRTPEEVDQERLLESLKLSPDERMQKAFKLMELNLLFSPTKQIKKPQDLGIVLKMLTHHKPDLTINNPTEVNIFESHK